MFQNIECQQERVEEFGDESIVGWRCECEEVDGAVFGRVGGDGAGEAAVGGRNGDREELFRHFAVILFCWILEQMSY